MRARGDIRRHEPDRACRPEPAARRSRRAPCRPPPAPARPPDHPARLSDPAGRGRSHRARRADVGLRRGQGTPPGRPRGGRDPGKAATADAGRVSPSSSRTSSSNIPAVSTWWRSSGPTTAGPPPSSISETPSKPPDAVRCSARSPRTCAERRRCHPESGCAKTYARMRVDKFKKCS